MVGRDLQPSLKASTLAMRGSTLIDRTGPTNQIMHLENYNRTVVT